MAATTIIMVRLQALTMRALCTTHSTNNFTQYIFKILISRFARVLAPTQRCGATVLRHITEITKTFTKVASQVQTHVAKASAAHWVGSMRAYN